MPAHPSPEDEWERAARIIASVAAFVVKTCGRDAAVSLLLDEAADVREERRERRLIGDLMHGTGKQVGQHWDRRRK